jgi:hypothetical protein
MTAKSVEQIAGELTTRSTSNAADDRKMPISLYFFESSFVTDKFHHHS